MTDYTDIVTINQEIENALEKAELMRWKAFEVGAHDAILVVTLPMLSHLLRYCDIEWTETIGLLDGSLKVQFRGFDVRVVKTELYNSEPHCIPVFDFEDGSTCHDLERGDTFVYKSSLCYVGDGGLLLDSEIELFHQMELSRILRHQQPSTSQSSEWDFSRFVKQERETPSLKRVSVFSRPKENDELEPSKELDDYIGQFKIIKE